MSVAISLIGNPPLSYQLQVAIKLFRGVHTDSTHWTDLTRVSFTWFERVVGSDKSTLASQSYDKGVASLIPHSCLAVPRCLPRYRPLSGNDFPHVWEWGCRDIPSYQSCSGSIGHSELWLAQTSIVAYIKQILGAARGLEYLHSVGVVHGGLKGVRSQFFPTIFWTDVLSCTLQRNVLINSDGQGVLADCGHSMLLHHLGYTAVMDSPRYLAPELIDIKYLADDPVPNLTEATDVYAFSMVTVEVGSTCLSIWRMNWSPHDVVILDHDRETPISLASW